MAETVKVDLDGTGCMDCPFRLDNELCRIRKNTPCETPAPKLCPLRSRYIIVARKDQVD